MGDFSMIMVKATDRDEDRHNEQGVDVAHTMQEFLESIEHDLILAALQASHGNKSKAARALGITERLMGLRVKRLGIDWRGFRPRSKQSAAHSA